MRLKTHLLTVLLLCWPVAAGAQNASGALLQQLYSMSGIETQVNQIPGSIQQAFDQKLGTDRSVKYMEHKVLSSLRKSLRSVFVPAIMKKIVLKELGARLSNDDIRNALAWLDSPQGRKITKLEEKTATPEVMRDIPKFLQTLQAAPPTQKRMRTIVRLDQATKATQTTTDVSIASALAVVTAFSAISPVQRDTKRPTLSEMRSSLDAARPQMEAALRQQIQVFFLYTYKSLSDPEMERYLAFVESKAGKKYHSATTAGISKAMLDSILHLESAITAEFTVEKL